MAISNTSVTVNPVFYFTAIPLGGFGFSPPLISLFMASMGVSQGIWLLVVFPRLEKKFGTVGVLRGCMIGWPLMLAILPFCNWLLRRGFVTTFVSLVSLRGVFFWKYIANHLVNSGSLLLSRWLLEVVLPCPLVSLNSLLSHMITFTSKGCMLFTIRTRTNTISQLVSNSCSTLQLHHHRTPTALLQRLQILAHW